MWISHGRAFDPVGNFLHNFFLGEYMLAVKIRNHPKLGGTGLNFLILDHF